MSTFWVAVIYVSVVFLPIHLLAYYPVRDKLRMPVWATLSVFFSIVIPEVLFFGYDVANGGTGRMIELLSAPVFFVIFYLCVKVDFFRLLFLFLFVSGYFLLNRGIALYLEVRMFPMKVESYISLRSAGIFIFVFLITAPFICMLLNRTQKFIFHSKSVRIWKIIWLIPAMLIVLCIVYTGNLQAENVNSFRFLLTRIVLPMCILVLYFVLMYALEISQVQAETEERNRHQEILLSMQRTQFAQLHRFMEQTRQARHDLRQHLNLIQAYLDEKDEEALRTYLITYGKKLPLDVGIMYCKNYALNVVVCYYAELAKENEIELYCQSNLPITVPFDEPEVCALLGNLLENAVEACKSIKQKPVEINLHMLWENDLLSITVDNPCDVKPEEKDGKLISTKHAGYGIGTESVRSIAKSHQGTAVFEWIDGEFRASVLLHMKK